MTLFAAPTTGYLQNDFPMVEDPRHFVRRVYFCRCRREECDLHELATPPSVM